MNKKSDNATFAYTYINIKDVKNKSKILKKNFDMS